jgi:hypothetical protein
MMLKENKIVCPECGIEINISNTIKKQIQLELKRKLNDLLEVNNKQQEYLIQGKYLHDEISMKERQIEYLKKEIEEKVKQTQEITILLAKIETDKLRLETRAKQKINEKIC